MLRLPSHFSTLQHISACHLRASHSCGARWHAPRAARSHVLGLGVLLTPNRALCHVYHCKRQAAADPGPGGPGGNVPWVFRRVRAHSDAQGEDIFPGAARMPVNAVSVIAVHEQLLAAIRWSEHGVPACAGTHDPRTVHCMHSFKGTHFRYRDRGRAMPWTPWPLAIQYPVCIRLFFLFRPNHLKGCCCCSSTTTPPHTRTLARAMVPSARPLAL